MAYFRYLLHSGTRHSVHSPFVYKLVDEVFRNQDVNKALNDIARLRQKLLRKTQLIEITDFGSGSNHKIYSHRFESVAYMVRNSSVSERYGRLLYRLVEYFNPQTILELGSSVGISTSYMALANPGSKVYTIEGCTTKSEQATTNFKELQLTNIEQHIGSFDIILPDLMKQVGHIDFAFIDGNHTYQATLANFKTLLEYSNNETVFVFDDIHWSAGMQKAWDEITDFENVTVSIDLFRIGIVFLKKELSKQKFVIRL